MKTSKSIKTSKVFLLCIAIGLMVVPAVSAQEGYDLESSKGIPLATIEDYIVTPYREDSPGTVDPLSTVNSPSTINSKSIEN